MNRRFAPILLATLAAAHPMGNFSVSHDTRLRVTPQGVEIKYVLDLAEVPAFELLKHWRLTPASPQSALDARAAEQMREWINGLTFRVSGKRTAPVLLHAAVKITEAPGSLFTARFESALHLDTPPGDLQFEDKNYPDRPGWKQISIDAAPGASLRTASQTSDDPTNGLTQYPASPPPNDLRAALSWTPGASSQPPQITPLDQPPPVAIEPTAAPAPPPKTDYLSTLLSRRDLDPAIILLGLAVAFGLGAIHALSPGHGKTIVAAYLVGSRGTMRHAAFLGAMVTFTHTASVFALGLATLFLSKYFVPERLAKTLEVISGLSIVAIGAWLLYQRIGKLRLAHNHGHSHHHHHHDHDHSHHHHDHTHTHTHTHTHVPQGDVTLGSLIALGASGGLVPCPSAMVLLLFAISVGRVGLGLILLVAFSAGLAGVLMTIGMLVLYAKQWLPDPEQTSRHGLFRYLPVASAAVIVCIGLVMTGVSIR